MKRFLFVWAFSTVTALADNTAPTAAQILGRMVTTYRSCNCYEDSGAVETVFNAKSRVWTNTRPFEIHFRRPALLRFEFTAQYSPASPRQKYVLWSDETQTHTYWQQANSCWADTDLSRGVAGATGVSGGAAHTVPRLLTDSIEGVTLAELGNLRLLREEAFEGANCYVIQGDYSSANRSCELWIGKDDFLLRKKKEQHPLPDGTMSVTEEIHRLIKINPDIPDTVFSFTPPEGTKLTEGIESVLADSQRQLAEAQAKARATIAAAQQRQLTQTSVFFIDCQPDGLTISPGGIKATLGDLSQAGNAFEKLLEMVATNRSFDRVFVWVHPGSMATYRAIRGVAGNCPVVVQYEPANDETDKTGDGSGTKTNRIVITSSNKGRSPIPADKHPVYFACCDNRVYLVNRNGQVEAQGESLEEINRLDSRFQTRLMDLDRSTQYVSFLVTENSFSSFRKARDIAERWAGDASWELIADDPITFDAARHVGH